MAAHAYAVLDAFVYGFAVQEAALPTPTDEVGDLAEGLLVQDFAERYPALHAFTVDHVLQPGYDFGGEFDFGLDLILDGLEARAADG